MDSAPALLAIEWQTTADQATAAGVVVSLLVGIATTIIMIRQDRLTRRGQALERQQSESAAARSEKAARLTEEYTRRLVDALEAMAAAGGGQAAIRPARVRWELAKVSGNRYVLTNVGDATASNVRVESDPTLELVDLDGLGDVDPGGVVTFLASPSLATSDYTITVGWADPDMVRKTWRYPLPA